MALGRAGAVSPAVGGRPGKAPGGTREGGFPPPTINE
jgi:hypothetical protein